MSGNNSVHCSHEAIFKLCRLEFYFQNLPFPTSARKKCATVVWTPAKRMVTVTFFAVFKLCGHHMKKFVVSIYQKLVEIFPEGLSQFTFLAFPTIFTCFIILALL